MVRDGAGRFRRRVRADRGRRSATAAAAARRAAPALRRPRRRWASDQTLLGLTFGGQDQPPVSTTTAPTTPQSAAADRPLRWRDPSPVADGPRSIVGTFGNNLLTVGLREDPVSSLAMRLLARTVRRNLVEFTQLVHGLDLIVEQVGGESLFALRAVPNAEGFDAAKTGHALIEAVEAIATHQQPVVTTVRPGQLITLANGTTVLLSDPAWCLSTDTTNRFEVLSANVRYRGGGETVDQNTAADARNYVDPERFAMTGIAAASRSINDLGSKRPGLEATELKQG